MNYLYLVLSKDFGLCPFTSVHATEAGAQAAIADLGYGGVYVFGEPWRHGDVKVGMKVRVGGVSTAYDEDFITPWLRPLNEHVEMGGRIVEVLP